MSKSFCINLRELALHRVVGGNEKILQRTVGAYDIAAALSKLGYNNVDEFNEVVPRQFGVIFSLDDMMQKATLGIPTTAQVALKRLGGRRSQLLLTFTY